MPLALGLEDGENIREEYLGKMLLRIEKHTGEKRFSFKSRVQKKLLHK